MGTWTGSLLLTLLINIDALGGLCGDDDEYDLLARRELVVV